MPEIPSTPSDGNVKVLLVPEIADTSAPTVAELTGEGVIDISCYLTGDGLNLTSDQAAITDERLCTTQVFEKPGRKTNTAEVTYIDNTNSAYETDSNEAAETLVEGSNHHIVTRRGVSYETEIESAQKVSVWPVQAGMQRDVPAEANSVTRTMQKLFVTGNVRQKVAVASAA
ncbi:hypothetical protein ACHABQ_02915 [Nesterenkonia aurantiaca]|uniref:phage tail tube protein n=1 Tax=Nesterenkonia aurantiaca TaxID=1436010 RepID=UPI003EE4DBC6